ncbi:uncharacterized protein LOC131881797 [Tigriopus californicus]|uniref:uncharacterized protein LOC131881797 n=1 Tax=Tigriopus californicus TaxID=6832 RepID=UPI0027D9D9D6|nr:uncharacterized protein LOC131881797 [Tigriopus californicus]
MAGSQGIFPKVLVVFLMVSLVFMGFEMIHFKESFGQALQESLVGPWDSMVSEDILTVNKSRVRPAKPELNFRLLCAEDRQRIKEVLEWDIKKTGWQTLTKYLAKTVTYPVQMACQQMKRLGHGIWSSKCYDGHKYVCIDDIDPKNCLVYSFGIANQISFEESIATMGCEVYGYDVKNTDVMKTNANPRLHFKLARIGSQGGKQLMDLLQENGHSNASITYLKVDIEGAETPALPIWIRSGALNNTKQLSFEFHHVEKFATQYWAIIQDLYRIGFRIISYDPNFCTTMSPKGFYQFFEIVFRKTKVCDE